MLREILRATATLTTAILAGRLMGLLREVALAARLATTEGAGVAVVLLTLPDLLTGLLMGAAAGAVLVPEFKRIKASSGFAGIRFFWQATVAAVLVSGTIALVVAMSGTTVARILAPGYDASLNSDLGRLIAIVSLAVPLTAAAAVSNALLQSEGIFAPGALGTFIFNAVIAVAIIAPTDQDRLGLIAFAIVGGAAVRWAVQVAVLAARVPLLSWAGGMQSRAILLLRSYGQALLAAVSLLLVPPIARAIASVGGPSDVAAFSYAQKLIELPLGTLGTVTSIAAFPFIAQLAAERNERESARLARRLTLVTWLVTLGPGLAFALAARPITSLVLVHGSMTADAGHQIADLATIGTIALPAYALAALFTSLLLARGDTRSVMCVTFGAVAIFVSLAPHAFDGIGLSSVMLSTTLVQALVAVGCAVTLHRNHHVRLFDRALLRDGAIVLVIAAALMIPVVALSSVGIFGGVLAAVVCGGLAVTAASALPMATLEGQSLVHAGFRRRRRGTPSFEPLDVH